MSRSVNIVLVEDNPADVLLLRQTLREAGVEYSMKVLEDGEETIEYFYSIAESPEQWPHLLILDLNLPKKDGHEVLLNLREIKSLDKLLIMALSTSEDPEDRKKVLAQDAAYVVKPANIGDIAPLLRSIEAAHSRASLEQMVLEIEQARQLLTTKKISKMLLVEDSPQDALLVRELLKHSTMADCKLLTVEDLASALDALAVQQVDIILADLGLPDAQGLDALTSLLIAAKGIPLIVLTGLDDEALAEQAVTHGAQDYLVKGQVDTRILVKSVRYAATRKRAEELALMAVANENSLLKEILDNAPISMAWYTTDLRISTCNTAFAKQFHLNPALVIGSKITDWVSISDSTLWHKVIFENSPFSEQCPLTTGEITGVTWDMTVWPVQAQGELPKGGIILALDITERIKLERQREDFIAALAHDIRNPLIGADRVLSLMTNPSLNEQDKIRMLNALKQSNKDVLTMLQNLLDIYRYEAAAVTLDLQLISIKEPINDAISSTSLIALENEVVVTQQITEDLPPVCADETALKRLFSNLLHNATKFSKRGGTVDLTAHVENDSIVVLVTDHGSGMTVSQQESLFKRFGESRLSKYTSGAGTGLGLYLCKQIVDAHHGRISCISEVGIGSTFEIRLPLDRMKN